ncbi:hypothetical protein OSB04_032213 [Centaurea solstitialis]|uniref:TIR domain-containing protein n=1 Tax=Centaurea solstitialis TaxID=347529 RepID=A0AA38W5I3_9ASTR|nr:hypothetical protein OSB04_032213 [Centaurea solstitialis]
MASSPSSFDSTSSSSSQSRKYDVFLSFRGTDTRNTFVDHLYYALLQQGIDTFKDDEELREGQTIRPSLLKAIEDSQIAVIVFSENYVDSSWCLQELEYIMKCKVERDQIVIPIFYHIDPSEVRKQKRKYGEAFAKYEAEKKNVESWRKALFDAGNLVGHVAQGPETIFIKEIVSTISKRLCVAISSDNENLVGIEDRMQALKSMLAIDSQDVRMIGIWGLVVVDIVGDVRTLIKSRLRRKKVLLVLDDVDDADQLEALAGSHSWFNEGSRIIITTRDQHLLNIQQVNVLYEISLLNHDEAMKLFCMHALRHRNHIEDYDIISNEVVSYARGPPLALKIMGSFLYDKNMSEWASALARLKDIPDGKILEQLKVSYDGLEPLVKDLFLDIACFFRGEEKDKAMVVLEACGLHPKIGVRTLIEKALIIVSKEGSFDMHDLIQEMGHYIVRGKYPRNPEKHSRENHWIEALEVWSLGRRVPQNLPCIVANMKELWWFSCNGFPATSLSRNFQSSKLSYLRLQSSMLEQLWKGDKFLPNLKVLDLYRSRDLIKTPDFQGLPCLERLRLNHCDKLTDIHPSISYHETLISVEMSHCTSPETFPPISGMKKLETLKLSWCSQLCNIPEIQMNMDNMVEISLKGTRIKMVPASLGQCCTNLLSLDLGCCKSLESIEGNFHLLKHLKEFYLDKCENLKIPTEGLFDVNCCLQVLYFYNTSFKDLHPGIKFLGFSSSLMKLSLRSCDWINGDNSSVICELSNLKVLDLGDNDFRGCPCSLLQLDSLKFLNLSGCYNLVELPDLPKSIAILRAYDCDGLEIVDLPTNLRCLRRISLPIESISGDVDRKVQSMLQGNAIKDYSISLSFYASNIQIRDFSRRTLMLELPRNWYKEFDGFLICIFGKMFYGKDDVITIEDVMDKENEDVLEVSDGTPMEAWDNFMCYIYISFGSLRHTSWWKSTHTTISFSTRKHTNLKVELVPGINKGDLIERVKNTTNSSFWDMEPVEIIGDSESCIEIGWCHVDMVSLFGR